MVFKILRAGRTIASLRRAVEEENDIGSYVREREKRSSSSLKEDVELLGKYVDWVRFSRPATLYAPPVRNESPEPRPAAIPAKGRTSLPVARVMHIIAQPERWADRHVIIEGAELTFFSSNRSGEHWHTLDDGTGRVVAVSRENVMRGRGTLFGVARRTPAGRQLFIEAKNFHELPQS